MKKIYFLLLSSISLWSCETSQLTDDSQEKAYVPVYESYDKIAEVKLMPEKKLLKSGKVYIYRSTLLVSEPGEGVHFFDNTDKKNPKRISFISVPTNQDVELRNNLLYVDNGLDLLTIDISDLTDIKVVNRMKDVFPYPMYPDIEGVKFVCPDPSLGYVVDWVLEDVDDPKCYR
ncbi:hypothetical protein [Jiulongibacter sp. NS-SX5]|uniref:hypothetical protein n=1 Tax=Jiulongibacter sp. NS-SX5 TaxID=3463854 RepID=UPI00405918EE